MISTESRYEIMNKILVIASCYSTDFMWNVAPWRNLIPFGNLTLRKWICWATIRCLWSDKLHIYLWQKRRNFKKSDWKLWQRWMLQKWLKLQMSWEYNFRHKNNQGNYCERTSSGSCLGAISLQTNKEAKYTHISIRVKLMTNPMSLRSLFTVSGPVMTPTK